MKWTMPMITIQMTNVSHRFTVNHPLQKEGYYYRLIFEEHFPSDATTATVPSIACSTPLFLNEIKP